MAQRMFETRTRVRYAETDASGIVYYSTYFVYFELGRIEMFRELGLTYDRHLPIAETACRYHASARFDDQLEIHSIVEQVRRCGFRIGSRVYRLSEAAEPVLLVEGHTAMVTVDPDNRPIPLPEPFRRAFGAAPRQEAS